MITSECWADCCEYCIKVDPSPTRELDPCTEMTKRCKGDTCRDCKPCKAFAAGVDFQDVMAMLKARPSKVRFGRIDPQAVPIPQRRLT